MRKLDLLKHEKMLLEKTLSIFRNANLMEFWHFTSWKLIALKSGAGTTQRCIANDGFKHTYQARA